MVGFFGENILLLEQEILLTIQRNTAREIGSELFLDIAMPKELSLVGY